MDGLIALFFSGIYVFLVALWLQSIEVHDPTEAFKRRNK